MVLTKQSQSTVFTLCYTSVAHLFIQLQILFCLLTQMQKQNIVNISDEAHSWVLTEVGRLKEKSVHGLKNMSQFWPPLTVCLNIWTHSHICLEIHRGEIKLGTFVGHETTIPDPCHHHQQKIHSMFHPGFLTDSRTAAGFNMLTPGSGLMEYVQARHLNVPDLSDRFATEQLWNEKHWIFGGNLSISANIPVSSVNFSQTLKKFPCCDVILIHFYNPFQKCWDAV